MFVFGSRMYGRKDVVVGRGYCDHCGAYGRNTSYTGRKWGHVYYIPLIPEGPRVRVVKECKKCSHGQHIPEKEIPDILTHLHDTSKKALEALLAGSTEADGSGASVPADILLAGTVETLHCFQQESLIEQILATLKERGLTKAHQLVTGESMEFQGKLDEAEAAYKQAMIDDPNDSHVLISLGVVCLKKNDLQSARASYERALEHSEDKLPALNGLLTVYKLQKDSAQLAETYEACFGLVPEFRDNKAVAKAYKSACKRSGHQPVAP